MKIADPDKLRSIKTLPSLIAYLRDELDWPVESLELDELTFDWSADQLLVSDSQARRLTDGVIRQLRPLTTGQPWGIFVVEFADDTFRRGALREILRGLVANRRRNPTLPAWQHENLLFICATRDYDQITFAHYRGEKAQKARLALFGWQRGSSYLRTLCEFNLPALRWPEDATDTSAWLKQWASAFDKEPLTKEFFKEIANWYFWTLKNCQFPKDAPKEDDGYDHISVIRLITRLIFCWFIREKGLIPDALFDERKLAEALLGFDPVKVKNKDSVFYRAILQNLFFATLNTEMDKRGWAKEDQNFMAHNLYRHKECFRKPGETLALFKNIPFLNGGLFECLDKDFGENAKPRYLRIDGFSRRPDSQPVVPDFLFFGPEQEVDLSKDYGDKKFRKVHVRGLIKTLNHYKFTIEENTPFDQEVALDPELCGKVFENLLAAYNPETGTTARKATGSFYTPREIVDYMVDESLAAFLKVSLTAENAEDAEKRLRRLISWEDTGHDFSEAETEKLIEAIDGLKALDPAVGSGAFPMGILHKLVHVLKKLDPRNEKWKERQIKRVRDAITTAEKIEAADIRERTIKELEMQIDGINDAFEHNELDYGRKLYLIENCIYGVDIQPIAVQIAKMRFFISLIVDQKVDLVKPNLGVRALPNLETKFVAANTLIGIHRPAQMLLRNPAIDKKEAELRQVREKHFNAKTPANKTKYREQDKKLRAEIADLLKTDGWDDKTARQLAVWDPYDQNASAPFFDPEWMFEITSGFDVVIGNPPYGFRDILSPEQKQYFRKVEGIAFPSGDMAELFVIKNLGNLVKPAGVLTFIIPKKSLYGESWMNVRKLWLANSLRFLMDASQAFENVLLEQVAFAVMKLNVSASNIAVGCLNPDNHSIEVFGSYALSEIFPADMRNAQIYRGLYPKTLLQRIKQYSVENNSDIIRGEIGITNITPHLTFESKGNYPCVKGIDIVRYGLKPSVRYLKKSIAKRFVDDYPQEEKLIAQEIIAHIENPRPHILIMMFLDNQKRLLNDTCVEIKVLDKRLNLKFVMAYYHSAFANWYAYNFVYNRAIRTMHFIDYYITQIPLPKQAMDDPATQKPIITIVDRILAAKQANPSADTLALEQEIDERVYRLYGLTEDEIRVVEDGLSS
ncbi:MAG: hypothetical protein L6437_08170 [Kiritimatiellae bacterium]|nr:hypothetical protein [Kiritimatiellia bacterium]